MAQSAIDTRDLKLFASAIRKASRQTGKEIREALKAAGEEVAIEARALAAQHSKKTAATIHVRVYGAKIAVQAGNADVPEAALLEAGNSSSGRELLRSGRTGKFKHPVFGNREVEWPEQDMHPYLGPAALARQEKLLEKLLEGVNKALRDADIRMT